MTRTPGVISQNPWESKDWWKTLGDRIFLESKLSREFQVGQIVEI